MRAFDGIDAIRSEISGFDIGIFMPLKSDLQRLFSLSKITYGVGYGSDSCYKKERRRAPVWR